MAEVRRAGQVVLALSLLAAVAVTTAQIIEGPPGSGYGWGSVVVSLVPVAAALIGMGLMAVKDERRFAWPTIGFALVLSVVILAALVGNWEGQSTRDRALDAVVAASVLTASATAVSGAVRQLRHQGGPMTRKTA